MGARLRRAREERGLTLERLSGRTRVTQAILRAIERNDSSAIPPRPYGRGFVRSYATEVGLDPEQTVRDFFSQFAPAPGTALEAPRTRVDTVAAPAGADRSRRRLAVVLIPAIVLALVLTWLIRGRAPERPAASHTAGTSGLAVPASASTMGTATAAGTTARTPARASADARVTLSLEATGFSWVTASVDGRRVIYRTLRAGERELLRGEREIRIRTGDAGALRWRIGEGTAAPMGRSGEVRTVTLTPADMPR